MGFAELSLEPTEEQKTICDATRKFCAEVWRPAAIELDKMSNPQDVIAPGSVLWDVLRKTYQLGHHAMTIPKELGGMRPDGLTSALLLEHMGWAAADIAVSVTASCVPFLYAPLSSDPEVQDFTRQFCEDKEAKMIGCFAITEPEHGSDWWLLEIKYSMDARSAPSLMAVLDGEEYVINGQKSSWVSNGTIATHALLFISLDPSAGMYGGCGIAVIPLNYPGISRGKPLDKLGQRALNQGEIFFDNVRIPKTSVICQDLPSYFALTVANVSVANATIGSIFTGTAQAALDEALEYAKQRVQGGRPIFSHQNVQLKLFDIIVAVEAARSLSRRVTVYNSITVPPASHYSAASKVFSTETAFRVASEAIQIFGGYGLSKDFHIEKIFRDARAAMIEDGVNETIALSAARNL
jgi:alkylation response protein AidB-like acyl-CoA dehydrogenase